MPTVLRIAGWRVVIYPNDHRPSHVHVLGDGHEAVFFLNCMEGPASLRENYGFSRRVVARILRELEHHTAELCAAWEEIHESC